MLKRVQGPPYMPINLRNCTPKVSNFLNKLNRKVHQSNLQKGTKKYFLVPFSQSYLLKKLMKSGKREITSVIFMELLGLKKNTFYKILKEYEENKLQPK